MSKELVLALILGLMVGFGATGTFYALQHRPASTNPPVTTDLSSANPSPTSDNPSGLTNQNLEPKFPAQPIIQPSPPPR